MKYGVMVALIFASSLVLWAAMVAEGVTPTPDHSNQVSAKLERCKGGRVSNFETWEHGAHGRYTCTSAQTMDDGTRYEFRREITW